MFSGRAWRVVKFGEPKQAIELEEMIWGEPSPGQVLIRVRTAGAGFPDAMMTAGHFPLLGDPLFGMGREAAGEVVAVAPVGDQVTGISGFLEGWGGFAEYAYIREGSAVRLVGMADDWPAAFRSGSVRRARVSWSAPRWGSVRLCRLGHGQRPGVHQRGPGIGQRANYNNVVEAVVETMRSVPMGETADPATEIGPMVTQRQQARVEKYIALGQEEGAQVVFGGTSRSSGLDRGWYDRPTVFADATNDMRICPEEIFGPVVAVIPFDDIDDAVRIANETEYRLAGSV